DRPEHQQDRAHNPARQFLERPMRHRRDTQDRLRHVRRNHLQLRRGSMTRKNLVAIALAVSLAALAAALIARPSGAAHRTYTLAYFTNDTGRERGVRAAAKRLGVRYILVDPSKGGPQVQLERYRSLIARHVDAIALDGYAPAPDPIFGEIRKAGILLIASGDD